MKNRIYSIVMLIFTVVILLLTWIDNILGNIGYLSMCFLAISAAILSVKQSAKGNLYTIVSILSVVELIVGLALIAFAFILWDNGFVGRVFIPNLVAFLIYVLSAGTVVMTFDGIGKRKFELITVGVSVITSLIALFSGANCTMFTAMFSCSFVLYSVNTLTENKLHTQIDITAKIESAFAVLMFLIEMLIINEIDTARMIVLIIHSLVLLGFSIHLSFQKAPVKGIAMK